MKVICLNKESCGQFCDVTFFRQIIFQLIYQRSRSKFTLNSPTNLNEDAFWIFRIDFSPLRQLIFQRVGLAQLTDDINVIILDFTFAFANSFTCIEAFIGDWLFSSSKKKSRFTRVGFRYGCERICGENTIIKSSKKKTCGFQWQNVTITMLWTMIRVQQ